MAIRTVSVSQTDREPRPRDVSSVDLPDGRALAFGGVPVVSFHLSEAQRHAGRGVRSRHQAIADLYPHDDGTWRVSDPNKELSVMSDLAAAVLFSAAAFEGLDSQSFRAMDRHRPLWKRVIALFQLREGLVRPLGAAGATDVFGRLIRGDADTCADDALEVVRALRPELAPPEA
jgi:hypothetical protein